jgi:CheY-like chemotaxis protein
MEKQVSHDAPHVLIVEDELVVGEVLELCVAAIGYRTTWVRTGNAALEAINGLRPDVVILDLWLPDIAGADVLETLGPSRVAALPVLAITAGRHRGDLDRIRQLGAGAVLLKPFTRAALTEALAGLPKLAKG